MLLADLNKVLEERPRKAAIAKAIRNELRIRMHLELAMTQAEASAAVTMHSDDVKARIPADRFAGYLSVFQFPVDTNLICGEISEAWKKLFDAQDSSFYYEFTSPDLRDDWDDYRTEVGSSVESPLCSPPTTAEIQTQGRSSEISEY